MTDGLLTHLGWPPAAAGTTATLPVASPLLPVSLPTSRVPIAVRPGTADDLPFIDALQKRHAAAVGWMPTATLAVKVRLGQVWVAEEVRGEMRNDECGMRNDEPAGTQPPAPHSPPPFSIPRSAFRISSPPLGYVIASDRYFKRDDVGVVYQMNVAPGAQRGLVGATLLKAAFDRAAYGCKLFCCWCAQDLAANHFWEAMGFVPLAFRAGGEKRKTARSKSTGGARVHIFWQRRIRAGDILTPYWFPAKTDAGAMREDRLVLPIPPGRHWSDEMPVLLPRESVVSGPLSVAGDEGGAGTGGDGRGLGGRKLLPGATAGGRGKGKAPALPPRARARFGPPSADAASPAGPTPPAPSTPAPTTPEPTVPAKVTPPRPKRKADPRLVAAARELRDRWLERVHEGGLLPATAGKYDVSRSVAGPAARAAARLPAPVAA